MDDLAALMENKAMKPAKLADLAIARLSCLQSLLLARSEEEKARLRFASEDALIKENEQLRKELEALRPELGKAKVSTKPEREETFDEKLARLVPSAKNSEEKSNV
ncbi:MAG: hypothetical protein WB660_05705 [Candidatus Sulfotelmatobacter sp.]